MDELRRSVYDTLNELVRNFKCNRVSVEGHAVGDDEILPRCYMTVCEKYVRYRRL